MEPQVMKANGFDPSEYSSIYSLKEIEGSKVIKVINSDDTINTIFLEGTCPKTFGMRAQRGTKQFAASLLRIRRKEEDTYCHIVYDYK